MDVEEVEYATLTDEVIGGLVEGARAHGNAAVLQYPIAQSAEAALDAEPGLAPVGVSASASEGFEALRAGLADAGVETVVVGSSARTRDEGRQYDEVDALVLVLSIVPALLLAPVGYLLKRSGHERLRHRLMETALVGPAGRFYREYGRTMRERLERECDAVEARSGTAPVVVAEPGTIG